jgi:hypothetical protein
MGAGSSWRGRGSPGSRPRWPGEIGAQVDVFETVRECVGGRPRVNLLPHAVRDLDALGPLEALTERSVTPTTLVNARSVARRSVNDHWQHRTVARCSHTWHRPGNRCASRPTYPAFGATLPAPLAACSGTPFGTRALERIAEYGAVDGLGSVRVSRRRSRFGRVLVERWHDRRRSGVPVDEDRRRRRV